MISSIWVAEQSTDILLAVHSCSKFSVPIYTTDYYNVIFIATCASICCGRNVNTIIYMSPKTHEMEKKPISSAWRMGSNQSFEHHTLAYS